MSCGGVGVEHVGQRHHAALAHQKLDHVDRALGHAARELLDGDRLRQHDLARDFLFLILRAVAFQPLGAATERGDRTRALLLARGRAGDGQPAAVALLAAARRARRRHDDLLSRQDQRRTPDDARRASSSSPAAPRARERSGQRRRQARSGATRGIDGDGAGSPPDKAPSRLVLRLTLEIGFLRAAKLFVALARFGGLAFEAVARLALAPRLGLRLLAAAVLLLARPRVDAAPGRAPRAARRSRWAARRRSWAAAARPVSPARPGRASPRRRERAWPARRRPGPERRRPAPDAPPRRRRRLARRQDPALHLLDDDRLAAPVRKALPHRALLNRALQMQRRLRRRGAHRLVAIVRFTHAYS